MDKKRTEEIAANRLHMILPLLDPRSQCETAFVARNHYHPVWYIRTDASAMDE